MIRVTRWLKENEHVQKRFLLSLRPLVVRVQELELFPPSKLLLHGRGRAFLFSGQDEIRVLVFFLSGHPGKHFPMPPCPDYKCFVQPSCR